MNQIFKKEIESYYWVNSIDSNNINVLSGSSTTLYGLSCNQLMTLDPDNSTYINLGGHARGAVSTYFLLKNLNLKKVKKVYFSLDYLNYNNKFVMFKNNIFYLDLNFYQVIRNSIIYGENILQRRYEVLFNFFFRSNDFFIEKNYIIPEDFGSKKLNDSVNFPLRDNFYYDLSDYYEWSLIQFEYLKKIQTLCLENNIKFTLFIPPFRSDFNYFLNKELIQNHKEFKALLSHYSISPSVFGKLDLFESKYDSLVFFDELHLNEMGQKEFTKMFYDLSSKEVYKLDTTYNWFNKNY